MNAVNPVIYGVNLVSEVGMEIAWLWRTVRNRAGLRQIVVYTTSLSGFCEVWETKLSERCVLLDVFANLLFSMAGGGSVGVEKSTVRKDTQDILP